MNVARMRLIDRWLGTPVCWLLTLWRKVFGRLGASPAAPPRRILFIKLAEQGSTVLAQSALRAAVEQVGRDNVFFLLFAENRAILDILDPIAPANVIAIDARGLVRAVVGSLGALARIRREKIDAVVDLEFFARSSAALAYLTGASRRAGYHSFNGEGPYRGDLMTHRVAFNPYLHTIQTFRLLVDALGHAPERFPTFEQSPPDLDRGDRTFRPTPNELAEARRLLRDQAGRRLVLLNANASDLMPLRRWPPERYVELARRLLNSRPDTTIAFTGAPAEAETVNRLVDQIASPRCLNLAGRTTLRQLLAVYGLADVLVTNDSGPAHFATLTPIEVVVLFGPETPKLFASASPRTHPLWAALACSPCINAYNNRQSSCRDNVCMKRIEVDDVLRLVGRLLDQRADRMAS